MQMRLGRDRVARELSAVPHPHYPTGPPPPPQTSPSPTNLPATASLGPIIHISRDRVINCLAAL